MTDTEETVLDELQQKASALGVDLVPEQRAAIRTFCQELIEYSSHTNLVGKAEFPVLVRDHVLDSLSLVPFFKARSKSGKKSGNQYLDIGSGGGFPAMIVCIALPELQATLIEASNKKCRFLDEVAKSLKMRDRIDIVSERAEVLAHEPSYRGKFDFGTARAVGTFDLSAELVMPYLGVGGKFFAQKSGIQKDEAVASAKACLWKLGGKLSDVSDLDEAVLGKARVVLIAEKAKASPADYPRSWAKIKSSPLGR